MACKFKQPLNIEIGTRIYFNLTTNQIVLSKNKRTVCSLVDRMSACEVSSQNNEKMAEFSDHSL